MYGCDRRESCIRHGVAGRCCIRGAGGEFVGGPVDVGVLVLVEVRQPVDDGLGLVGGGGVVEPDQRPAIHPLLQDGEVPPHGLHVEGRAGALADGGGGFFVAGGQEVEGRGRWRGWGLRLPPAVTQPRKQGSQLGVAGQAEGAGGDPVFRHVRAGIFLRWQCGRRW